jgi:hypothetical protein
VRSFKFILKVGVEESIEKNVKFKQLIRNPYNALTINSSTPTLRIKRTQKNYLRSPPPAETFNTKKTARTRRATTIPFFAIVMELDLASLVLLSCWEQTLPTYILLCRHNIISLSYAKNVFLFL